MNSFINVLSSCVLLVSLLFIGAVKLSLTLILPTWKIWRAPNNASKWQMGFNSAFKGLRLP
jgi:hypothetical protein